MTGDRQSVVRASPPRRARWRRVLGWLRFLLIVPIFIAVERQSDRSLRWRLVSSHLATVVLSIAGVALLLSALVILVNWLQNPLGLEPAAEAHLVAETLQDMGWVGAPTDPSLDGLLSAYAAGAVQPILTQTDVQVNATVVRSFAHVRSISVVDASGRVVASSDPGMVGLSIGQVSPAASVVTSRALSGVTEESNLATGVEEDADGIVGAFPIRDGTGAAQGPSDSPATIVGAVVMIKDQRSFPSSALGIASLAARYAVTVGTVLIVLVLIPAVIVALLIGIGRARSIARPVNDLARAAERLSAGDLSVRVWVPSDDEVARLARAFNRMGDQLQQSLEQEAEARARAERLLATNRDLVANVSHELRTPVALIRGHIEALADEPARLDEYADIALRESDRLENLVDDLFQLARIDAQGLHLASEPFDAGAVVREAIDSLAGPARRDADLIMRARVDGTPDDLTVLGDRARLVQVLQNLLRNAVRYTPEGGLIRAVADRQGDQVVIRVQDTGYGIAPEDVARVFDRFFRSDQSHSRKGGGAGLGLAIAKQSVEGMGGTIAVESEVGEGTIFTITLPHYVPPVASDSVPPVARPAGRPAGD